MAVKSGLSLDNAAEMAPSEIALWNCMNDALSGATAIQSREYDEAHRTE